MRFFENTESCLFHTDFWGPPTIFNPCLRNSCRFSKKTVNTPESPEIPTPSASPEEAPSSRVNKRCFRCSGCVSKRQIRPAVTDRLQTSTSNQSHLTLSNISALRHHCRPVPIADTPVVTPPVAQTSHMMRNNCLLNKALAGLPWSAIGCPSGQLTDSCFTDCIKRCS